MAKLAAETQEWCKEALENFTYPITSLKTGEPGEVLMQYPNGETHWVKLEDKSLPPFKREDQQQQK